MTKVKTNVKAKKTTKRATKRATKRRASKAGDTKNTVAKFLPPAIALLVKSTAAEICRGLAAEHEIEEYAAEHFRGMSALMLSVQDVGLAAFFALMAEGLEKQAGKDNQEERIPFKSITLARDEEYDEGANEF